MKIEYKYAITEVLKILDMMTDKSKEKIPTTLIDFLKRNRLNDERDNIKYTFPLEANQISNEGKILLKFICTYFK